MTSKITRPFPVPATVVMRSTLFALAGMNATLHTYNEESGVIVASVSKWLGVQKQEVVARVRGFDDTAQLELEVPDQAKAQELLSSIAGYVSDGAKIEAAATIQWVDLERQRASKAKRQDMLDRVKRFLPGTKKAPTAEPEIVEAEVVAEDGGSERTAGAESTALTVSIPDNPQVLVKDPQNQMIDLKVDPEIFKDRSTYLMTCQHCAATNLRGSSFCAACGKPLTLEAIQPELKGGVDQAAKNGLTFATIGLVLNLIPALVFFVSTLFVSVEGEPNWFELLNTAVTSSHLVGALLLGVIPALVMGWLAIQVSQKASWYLNLTATFGQGGRTKIIVATALGWLNIYLGLAWLIFIFVLWF